MVEKKNGKSIKLQPPSQTNMTEICPKTKSIISLRIQKGDPNMYKPRALIIEYIGIA